MKLPVKTKPLAVFIKPPAQNQNIPSTKIPYSLLLRICGYDQSTLKLMFATVIINNIEVVGDLTLILFRWLISSENS